MAERIEGSVASINDAGDLITDIALDQLAKAPTDERVTITCDGHVTSCLLPADHQQEQLTFIALKGNSGFLELSLVGEDASKFLGVRAGAAVMVQW